MKPGEEAIKSHRGIKLIGISLVLLTLLFAGYFFRDQIVPSQNAGAAEINSAKRIEAMTKNIVLSEGETVYKEIFGNNTLAVFTGIEKINDTTFTNSLQIQIRDSSTIKYRIESLINWKGKKNRIGTAFLDQSSIGSENWKIEDRKGTWHPAYRFIDKQEECEIEIFISKGNYRRSNAIVKETCSAQPKFITVPLRYK